MGETDEPRVLVQGYSELDGKYLAFFADNQLYGIPVSSVVQIVGIQQITEIPGYPQYAKGIINLRGEVIPIVDFRLRINKPEKQYDDRTCIVVISIEKSTFGLIVEGVDEVAKIDSEQIAPPPELEQSSKYITGIAPFSDARGEKMILLIDALGVLGDKIPQAVCAVN